jgi:carbonic anhydrase
MSTLLVLSAVGNLGKKGAIMVVHHTDCGLQTANDEEIRTVLGDGIGKGGKESLEGTLFGSFERPEESVKEDVGILRSSPFFQGMQIVGFVQDTETGLLSEVVGLE